MTTIYLPDLYRVDPGMVDPLSVGFVMLPGIDWVADQRIPDAAAIASYGRRLYRKHEQDDWYKAMDELVPLAFLFAVYLDRRTRCPLIADGRFYLQITLACLRDGLAGWPTSTYSRHREAFSGGPKFETHGLDEARIATRGAIAFGASQVDVETIMAKEVDVFFERVGSGGYVQLMKGEGAGHGAKVH